MLGYLGFRSKFLGNDGFDRVFALDVHLSDTYTILSYNDMSANTNTTAGTYMTNK